MNSEVESAFYVLIKFSLAMLYHECDLGKIMHRKIAKVEFNSGNYSPSVLQGWILPRLTEGKTHAEKLPKLNSTLAIIAHPRSECMLSRIQFFWCWRGHKGIIHGRDSAKVEFNSGNWWLSELRAHFESWLVFSRQFYIRNVTEGKHTQKNCQSWIQLWQLLTTQVWITC